MTCKNPHFSGNLLSFLNPNHYSLPSIAWTLAVHFIKQHLARFFFLKSALLEQRRVLKLQGLAVQLSSADSKTMYSTHLMRLCKGNALKLAYTRCVTWRIGEHMEGGSGDELLIDYWPHLEMWCCKRAPESEWPFGILLLPLNCVTSLMFHTFMCKMEITVL